MPVVRGKFVRGTDVPCGNLDLTRIFVPESIQSFWAFVDKNMAKSTTEGVDICVSDIFRWKPEEAFPEDSFGGLSTQHIYIRTHGHVWTDSVVWKHGAKADVCYTIVQVQETMPAIESIDLQGGRDAEVEHDIYGVANVLRVAAGLLDATASDKHYRAGEVVEYKRVVRHGLTTTV